MSEAPRITRPRLEVDRARRQPSVLFAAGRGAGGRESEPHAGDAVRGAPGPANAISRSVELGYRVIDEYVRQGSSFARSWSARALDPAAAQGDVRELGERMMQYATEAMSIWLELLGSTGAGAAPPPGARPPGEAVRDPTETSRAPAARPAAAPPVAPPLAIAIDSARPVEVSVRLHDPGGPQPLRVHDLRAGPGEPRLLGVRIEADAEGRPRRVRIRVEDSLPAGTYNGLIIDDISGLPAGTVSVTIAEEWLR
jgi:hypothetical protein